MKIINAKDYNIEITEDNRSYSIAVTYFSYLGRYIKYWISGKRTGIIQLDNIDIVYMWCYKYIWFKKDWD